MQKRPVTIGTDGGEGTLTLHAGRDADEDVPAIRGWIEQHVDIGRLTLAKRTTTAAMYWRERAMQW